MMELTVNHPLVVPILAQIHNTPLPIGHESTLRFYRNIRNNYEGAVLWTLHHRLGLLPPDQAAEARETWRWDVQEAYNRFLDSQLTLAIAIFDCIPVPGYPSAFEFWGAVLQAGMRHEFMTAGKGGLSKRRMLDSWRRQRDGLTSLPRVNPIPENRPELEPVRLLYDLAIMLSTHDPNDDAATQKRKQAFIKNAMNPHLDALKGYIVRIAKPDAFKLHLEGDNLYYGKKSRSKRKISFGKPKGFKSGRGRKSK